VSNLPNFTHIKTLCCFGNGVVDSMLDYQKVFLATRTLLFLIRYPISPPRQRKVLTAPTSFASGDESANQCMET